MPSFLEDSPSFQKKWEREHMADYSPLSDALPLKEASLIQTGRGTFDVSSRIVDAGAVSAAHTVTLVPSVAHLVEHADQLMFFIARGWSGELKTNGQLVQPHQVHFADSDHSLYITGKARDMLGVAISRDVFNRTAAALQGIPVASIYKGLPRGDSRPLEVGSFSETVLGAVTEAYLTIDAGAGEPPGLYRRCARVVRAVEELFERAGPAPLSRRR